MTTHNTEIRIICGRRPVGCGFNVDAGYYARKQRFEPNICVNCGGPIKFLDWDNQRELDRIMVRRGPNQGQLVTPSQLANLESTED